MSGKEIKLKQGKIPKALLPGYEWEIFGGKGKRIKKGKPIKKRVYQEDIPQRPSGLGAALRGGGRAFYKGGKV